MDNLDNHETQTIPVITLEHEEITKETTMNNSSTSIKAPNTRLNCGHCSQKFLGKARLIEHLKTHQVRYSDCRKSYQRHRYRASHVEEVVTRQMYDCSVCEYQSSNRATLKDHYICHHTNKFNYACEHCGKQFKLKKARNHHVKHYHNGTGPSVCDICGHFSKNIHALRAHKKYKHQPHNFSCKLCNRGMTTQENLEKHLIWHQTREKIVCPTCGKSFRGRDLNSHLRVHSGVKPFPCPVCGKCFKRVTAQAQHVLLHTGKKPYVCDICGDSFAQKPGLIGHRKRHPGPLPPLPVVSIKEIVTEFTREFEMRNAVIQVE